MSQEAINHLSQPALSFARHDLPRLNAKWTVGEALEDIRKHDIGERLIYFYLVDDNNHLKGIVPTRRLLGSELEVLLNDIMRSDVIVLSKDATVQDACRLFAAHKYLAFPIVDETGRLEGVVDIGFFRDEQLSFAERQQIEDAFQLIGFGLSEISNKSPLGTFRYRFPWLLVTIICGTLCAILSGLYEATLQKMIVFAFFLTLVGGLSESVSMQSMTIVIQKLHIAKPSWNSYFRWLRTETISAVYLGIASGLLVAAISWCWRSDLLVSAVIGTSIFLSIVCSCILGLSIPALLHAVHEDSKIAAGPITLALADLTTIFIYLNAAAIAIR
jgi:Mg/Co/Ni transporter MgtE (contains CBS domain)